MATKEELEEEVKTLKQEVKNVRYERDIYKIKYSILNTAVNAIIEYLPRL